MLTVSSYTKVVVKGMTKAEMVLKVVMYQTNQTNQPMSHIENVRTFVEQFRKLLPDSDLQDLQRVLEMKVSCIYCTNFIVLLTYCCMSHYIFFTCYF